MNQKPIPMFAHIAVDVIFKKNDHILLLKRISKSAIPGKYSFIGGKCDEGESIVEAVIREAQEEVGARIQPEDLNLVHVVHKVMPGSTPGKDWIFFIFMVERWQGELLNKEPEKHSEMTWVTLDQLPLDLGEVHAQAIAEWRKKNLCSVFSV